VVGAEEVTSRGDRCQVLCAGVVVADHLCSPIDHLPAPGELVLAEELVLELGGCASNVAVDLAKMGVSCWVNGCVGDDVFGTFVKELLTARGVDCQYLHTVTGAPTSQTMILNVRGEDRRFVHCFGANAHFAAKHIPVEVLREAQVVYVGGYLVLPQLTGSALAKVFREAQHHGARTVLDVVVPAGAGAVRRLLEELKLVLPHTDVFLPNDDEGRLLTGLDDPVKQALLFRDLGAKTVVITMGARGSVLVSPNVCLKAGVFTVPFVDATGSGDAFDAGYIVGLLEGRDEVGCLELASALGASCVRAIGTTPGVFTRDECEAFLREHKLPVEFL
jgi:sugar/nucleoside kinase (ribokinase family)